ncbi:hypothetical protein AKJ09_01238 [Labilithrix luteola]|uniref:Lipoprotein n=1 Tax=Labilithrix luteola TaxID=1391654 RepID=A0A0K1PN85_9BACT|nr:hypothetical protein [Labilithrix luteola]AKU94574.1 hypothetical protein AKJ09_01238 [Labilithrix luteola]
MRARIAIITASILTASAGTFLAGCSVNGDDDGAGTSAAAITDAWSKTLTCDDGAAFLDTDDNDARHAQFVVRNRDIVGYLSSKVNHIQNANREVILQGYTTAPIETVDDFETLTDSTDRFDTWKNFDSTVIVRVTASAHRELDGRVRLAFDEVTTHRSCSGYVDEIYCRNGEWSETYEVRELANWVFQGCH